MTLKEKAFENNVGKGENPAFSPFPTMFSTLPETGFFYFTFKCFFPPSKANLNI